MSERAYLDACEKAVRAAEAEFRAADAESRRLTWIAEEATIAMQAAATEATRLHHVLEHARRRLTSTSVAA